MQLMLALFIFNQTFADSSWPQYGATLENTRYQIMKGKMDTPPIIKWSYITGGWVESSPAVADVNNDDTMEVIIGSNDSKIYCLNGITGALKWSCPVGSSIWSSSPSAADVDGDGIIEIIIGSSNFKVNCLNGATGALKWQFTAKNEYVSAPAIADIDTNGTIEIVITSNSSPIGSDSMNVYCLNGLTGTQKWVYVSRIYSSSDVWISSPALADVDNDSIMEVFVGCKDSYMYCINGITGTKKWEYKTGNLISASPSVADVDRDGTFETVIGSYDGKIYSLNAVTGAIEWSYNTGGTIWASSAIADLEGDGIIEVLSGNRSGNTLYCLNGTTGGVKWTYSMGVQVHRSISVADIDMDNKLEVIPSTFVGAANPLRAFNGEDGSMLWTKTITTFTNDIHDIAIADIDNDGCVELLLGTAEDKAIFALDDSLNANGCGGGAVEENSNLKTQNSKLKIVQNKILLSLPLTVNHLRIAVYDLCGRMKQEVYSGTLSKGSYTFTPNLKTGGIYFVVLKTGNFKTCGKLVLMK